MRYEKTRSPGYARGSRHRLAGPRTRAHRLTIQDWHGIFRRFDQDNSGLIDRRELHAALQGFGFNLPADMVIKLEKRFAPPPKAGENPHKGISFDRFLMACVTVKHYTEAFRRFDTANAGAATLDYNAFVSVERVWGQVKGMEGRKEERERQLEYRSTLLTPTDGHCHGRAQLVDTFLPPNNETSSVIPLSKHSGSDQ
jgi:Ca2+-binding EF-hand superfamily protein